MATMKDIARLANTSIGTVDRALNRKSGVSEKTRNKILAIAESLDYKTNQFGKALVYRNKNLKLAFIVEPVFNAFFADIKAGIEMMREHLQEWGITTQIFCMNTHEEWEMLDLLNKLEDMGVAGIALTAINSESVKEKLRYLRAKGVKVVTCSTDVDPDCRDGFVGFQHERSGRVAAELMSKFNGRQGEFLVIIGYKYILAHMQRAAGFQNKISEDFPNIHIAGVIEVEENDELAYDRTTRALDANPNINGIFITGYGIRGVASAVKVKKKDGRDISVICYDNHSFVREYARQGIIEAFICQDPVRQGYMALKMLGDFVTGADAPPANVYLTNIDIRIAENMETIPEKPEL